MDLERNIYELWEHVKWLEKNQSNEVLSPRGGGGSGSSTSNSSEDGRPFYYADTVNDLPDPSSVDVLSFARTYDGFEYIISTDGQRWVPWNILSRI